MREVRSGRRVRTKRVWWRPRCMSPNRQQRSNARSNADWRACRLPRPISPAISAVFTEKPSGVSSSRMARRRISQVADGPSTPSQKSST